MPPKKKMKEPETTPQAQSFPSQQLQKIPKRPFYRSADLNSDKRAKHIQIKLWKIDPFKVLKTQLQTSHCDPPSFLATDQNFEMALRKLSKKQRVLKNLRRLYDDINLVKKVSLDRWIARSWRLQKLLLDCYHSTFSMKKFMRSTLHSGLKDFFIVMENPLSQKSMARLVNGWKYLSDCNIWLDFNLFNTKEIRSLERYTKQCNSQSGIIESIEGFQYENDPCEGQILDLSSFNPRQLPNLKHLRVSYSSFDKSDQHNLDFIQNYPQLISLKILTRYRDVPSLEFLSSLPNLKQFAMNSLDGLAQKVPKTLPLIHSLEKINLACHPTELTQENLQEFFINNIHLKHLQVRFPPRDDFLIFQEDLALPIETLELIINKAETSLTTIALKNLASFFSKHKHIKSLHIDFSDHKSLDLCEILLKGMTSITSLEHLRFSCKLPKELQENKLKYFKNIFIQSSGIQKLQLDLGEAVLMSRDFSNILDGLLHLKKLKYLYLKVSLAKVSPTTFHKFLQFLSFIIFENTASATLALEGIPQGYQHEIETLVAQKHDLFD